MARIEISDEVGVALTVQPREKSLFRKILSRVSFLRFPGKELAGQFSKGLDLLPENFSRVGAALDVDAPLAQGDFGSLEASACASIDLAVHRSGKRIFPDYFGEPFLVPSDRSYLSVAVGLGVEAGGSAAGGLASAGLAVGAEREIVNCRSFAHDDKNFGEALVETLSQLRGLDGLDDLKALPVGALAAVGGNGDLIFSLRSRLRPSINPLATFQPPAGIPGLRLSSKTAQSFGMTYRLAGEYQIRARRVSEDEVHLGFHRRKRSQFGISASLSAGLTAVAGPFELIGRLMTMISSNPEVETRELEAAGLDEHQIEEISRAVRIAIERSFSLALRFDFSADESDSAAFLFSIRLSQLDQAGLDAVEAALDGDLRPLSGDPDSLPEGIRILRSLSSKAQGVTRGMKINLLGVFNYFSISRLMLEGKVVCDEDTGELVITDKASASRIEGSAVVGGEGAMELRHLLSESFFITAIYRGSHLALLPPGLTSRHSFFALHSQASRETMKDQLDIGESLGLIAPSSKPQLMQRYQGGQRSLTLAQTEYDDQTARRLFFRSDGTPRPREDYESFGRRALGLLVQEGDGFQRQRRILLDDRVWEQLRRSGQPGVRAVVPQVPSRDLLIALVTGDYSRIVWWSKTMSEAARALHSLESLFTDGAPSRDDPRFLEARQRFAERMKRVAADSKRRFGDPWGLVAMDLAADRQAQASFRLLSSSLSFEAVRQA